MSISFVVLMYAMWSTVFSIGKIALTYSSPLFLTGSRMLLASVLILGYLFLFKPSFLKLKKKQFFSILLLALFSIYLTNILEFWALQYLSAGKACFIYSLSPFFASLFSYLHFKEKMNARKWVGFLIGFIGFVPVLSMQTGDENLLQAFSIFSWPALAIMGAALSSVYGWVLLRLIVKDNELSPLTANGWSMGIGGAFALIHSLFIESWNPLPIAPHHVSDVLQNIFMITMISNIFCYNLYGWMLKKYTATFLSFVGLLSPIFASLSAWLFLGEVPSPILFLSTLLVCLGLGIVYQTELKQGYILRPGKKSVPLS